MKTAVMRAAWQTADLAYKLTLKLARLVFKKNADARAATELRDVKMDELDAWMADYKVVAQIAFNESPQMLKQLGFGLT